MTFKLKPPHSTHYSVLHVSMCRRLKSVNWCEARLRRGERTIHKTLRTTINPCPFKTNLSLAHSLTSKPCQELGDPSPQWTRRLWHKSTPTDNLKPQMNKKSYCLEISNFRSKPLSHFFLEEYAQSYNVLMCTSKEQM